MERNMSDSFALLENISAFSDADCRTNYTHVLLFINDTDPFYFVNRRNSIVVLFSLASLGIVMNVYMARVLFWNSAYKQSANALLTFNLSLADLSVGVFCLMSDGIWNVTMQWMAGNTLCRLVKFMQMFSLYATTLILTGMTVERCITISYPISQGGRQQALRRARIIVVFAWILAAFCSIPNAVIFHVARAPICPDFYQCVTHGFYSDPSQELAYTMTTLVLNYILPLIVICLCYIIIFASFSHEVQQALGRGEGSFNNTLMSEKPPERKKQGTRLYQRARRMSLWMTFVIAVAFVVCWTPYYILMFGHLFHWEIAPDKIFAFLCFGMSNSVLNPIIFGAFRLCGGKGPGRRLITLSADPQTGTTKQYKLTTGGTIQLITDFPTRDMTEAGL